MINSIFTFFSCLKGELFVDLVYLGMNDISCWVFWRVKWFWTANNKLIRKNKIKIIFELMQKLGPI